MLVQLQNSNDDLVAKPTTIQLQATEPAVAGARKVLQCGCDARRARVAPVPAPADGRRTRSRLPTAIPMRPIARRA